jgi:transcription initiation factor TFIID subunit TAF12
MTKDGDKLRPLAGKKTLGLRLSTSDGPQQQQQRQRQRQQQEQGYGHGGGKKAISRHVPAVAQRRRVVIIRQGSVWMGALLVGTKRRNRYK